MPKKTPLRRMSRVNCHSSAVVDSRGPQRAHDARVVEHHVDPAELIDGGLNQGFDLRLVGDVTQLESDCDRRATATMSAPACS